MKRIGNYVLCVLLLGIILLAYSCKTVTKIPQRESHMDSVVIEKLVPVTIPEDSATIKALLECDENGQVLLKWLDEQTSKNAQLKFLLDSMGRMNIKVNVIHDTHYIPSKEATLKKEKLIPYPVEKKLTRWQQIKMDVGGYAIVIIVTIVFIVFGKLVYRLKK